MARALQQARCGGQREAALARAVPHWSTTSTQNTKRIGWMRNRLDGIRGRKAGASTRCGALLCSRLVGCCKYRRPPRGATCLAAWTSTAFLPLFDVWGFWLRLRGEQRALSCWLETCLYFLLHQAHGSSICSGCHSRIHRTATSATNYLLAYVAMVQCSKSDDGVGGWDSGIIVTMDHKLYADLFRINLLVPLHTQPHHRNTTHHKTLYFWLYSGWQWV